jgi:cell division protein ZapA
MTDSQDTLTVDDRGRAVRVRILDQEYPIHASADEEYIRQVASFLDERMRAVQAADPTRPLSRVAILTALNLAHELMELKREKKDTLLRIEQKAEEISASLDRGLFDSI